MRHTNRVLKRARKAQDNGGCGTWWRRHGSGFRSALVATPDICESHRGMAERVRQQQAEHRHLHDGHGAVHPLRAVLSRVPVVALWYHVHRQRSIHSKLL